MKLLTFLHEDGPRPGVLLSDRIGLDLVAAEPDLPRDWPSLFPHLELIEALAEHWHEPASIIDGVPLFSLGKFPMLPPITAPSKIMCVGLNYRDHAEEQNKTPPPRPMFFSKAATCLQGHEGPVTLDDDLNECDAEAELAVVISKAGRRIPRERAEEHIAGYTCFNDVSDREAQYADRQYFRGKSIDTGGPCGPWIVTPDELPRLAHGLDITGSINGVPLQQSNTDQLIFPIDELIAHISSHMTLLPGDILSTGTPAGVGVFRDPPIFLRPDDVIEVEIEGIGVLSNPVVAI